MRWFFENLITFFLFFFFFLNHYLTIKIAYLNINQIIKFITVPSLSVYPIMLFFYFLFFLHPWLPTRRIFFSCIGNLIFHITRQESFHFNGFVIWEDGDGDSDGDHSWRCNVTNNKIIILFNRLLYEWYIIKIIQ